MTTQIYLEPEQATKAAGGQRVKAGVKTILLHVQNDKSLDSRVQTALALARACEAHLSCVHITPIESYVAFDSFGGVFVMNDVIAAVDEEAVRIRKSLHEKLRNEDVSWDYVETTANIASQIVSRAALTDLVVTGREPHRTDFAGPTIGLLGELLHRARTPLFIPADDGTPPDPAGTALIAWDGSYEAANAVRSAVGLLKVASQVRILQIREKAEEAFPGTKLLEYLSRHDIHAELFTEEASSKEFVSDALVAHARAIGAAYLVMGGYNHSRVGEFVFGGVTRSLLKSSPVPLLIAH